MSRHYRSILAAQTLVLDDDAADFVIKLNLSDSTKIAALNRLVLDLKGFPNSNYVTVNQWPKHRAIYPVLSDGILETRAFQHKWNLKDRRDLNEAHRLTFFGGFTHLAGLDFNGGSYANTYIVPSTHLSQNDAHMSFYSTENVYGGAVDMGAIVGGTDIALTNFQNEQIIDMYGTSGVGNRASTLRFDTTGFFIGSRVAANDLKLYANGVEIASNNSTVTGNISAINVPIFLGAWNSNGSPALYTSRNCAFSTVGAGLTPTEALALTNAVMAFKSATL